MDIRTKLAIALVSVSLLSMTLLGYFAYQASAELLQDISERQLDALAESKARDVSKVVESWRDRVRLVASRTQLRADLSAYNNSPTPPLRSRITRIVQDAERATPSLAAVALYSATGERLVASGRVALLTETSPAIQSTIDYLGIVEQDSDNFARFAAPLELAGSRIGGVEIVFTTGELDTVTGDYTGLGDSGETILIRRGNDGRVQVLNPLRHGESGRTVAGDDSEYLNAALNGEARVFTNQPGYRGTIVWAATRFLDDVNWGLVVQVDETEELVPLHSFRDALLDLGLSLGAFAILGGSLLGLYLARPLHRLAETVDRVNRGETDLRADDSREDEIGLVAHAINAFLDREASSREPDG